MLIDQLIDETKNQPTKCIDDIWYIAKPITREQMIFKPFRLFSNVKTKLLNCYKIWFNDAILVEFKEDQIK